MLKPKGLPQLAGTCQRIRCRGGHGSAKWSDICEPEPELAHFGYSLFSQGMTVLSCGPASHNSSLSRCRPAMSSGFGISGSTGRCAPYYGGKVPFAKHLCPPLYLHWPDCWCAELAYLWSLLFELTSEVVLVATAHSRRALASACLPADATLSGRSSLDAWKRPATLRIASPCEVSCTEICSRLRDIVRLI